MMTEIERHHGSIGGLAAGLMAATLLNPTPPMREPHIIGGPFIVYRSTANTYALYADIFDPKQLSERVGEGSIMSFYMRLLAKQQRLGADFEKVLFDNLWDLYAR